ncbi:MAG: 23S rRNA (cytidine(2498)-2'-O)-methyltransferase RlmM [Rhodocyclaceae bacterium]|nr:23S rRNA (cytidine(2498)-2'-O)-methyltransferase RlmM [Rhodocyclaceae bacterium]
MPHAPHAIGFLAQCRAGFEAEAAQELAERARSQHIAGRASPAPRHGYVMFQIDDRVDWATLQKAMDWRTLCFARQAWPVVAHLPALPERDRASPIADVLAAQRSAVGGVMLEYPDTNDGKARSGFCKRFEAPLGAALTRAGLLKADSRRLPRLHVFFPDATQAWIGLSDPRLASDWPLGIPRLRMPREAPSRSTLKLAEALLTLLDAEERARWLRPGAKAVDLGAAPGGWSWQLASRGLRVTAIDNGAIDAKLLAGGMVTHVRADGFVWKPRSAVDWMVCDMVEQPARIAALVAEWLGKKHCRHAIFNLKLPMKKRHQALQQCAAILTEKLAGVPLTLRFKQLYHDREEVTAYISRHDTR